VRVLFFGERPVGSAPSLSLARILQACGHQAAFEDFLDQSTRRWIQLVRWAHVAMLTHYGKSWHRTRRIIVQVRLARALGTPVVRWWVGSDVWNAMHDDVILNHARLLDRCVAANVALASHLRDELGELRIQATVISRPLVEVPVEGPVAWNKTLARSILVYLPTKREDFYGARVLDQLFPSRRDLTFHLVADDGTRYSRHENVVSHGWVGDMEPVYRQVGCLLRITQHDGFLPRMVREALARGKYVIWSRPCAGSIQARHADEVCEALSKVAAMTTANYPGIEVMRSLPGPAAFAGQVAALVRRVRARRWLDAALGGANLLLDVYQSWRRGKPLLPVA
jgi:hypothetical protein